MTSFSAPQTFCFHHKHSSIPDFVRCEPVRGSATMSPKSLKRSSAHLSERPSTAKKPKTQFSGSEDPKHVLPPTHTFLISVPATGKRIPLRVLLDTGAGVACLDVGYVQRHGIPTRPLSRPLLLR